MRPLLLGLGLAFLAGCSSSGSDSGNGGPVSEAKSALVRNTAPTVVDADKATFAKDNEAFALSAYGALAKKAGANVFFSPYSISSALAMAYAGANGPTATEMASALHFSLPQAQLHAAFDSVDLALDKTAPVVTGPDGTPSTPFTLHVTNSMWGQKGLPFQAPFLDTLATSYGAGVYLEDFAADPSGAEATINQWVSDQTNAKITKLLNGNLDALTRLVLVDAIYFDADWQSTFDKSATAEGPFTTDGGSVTVPMMHQQTGFRATQTDAFSAVELPYQGTTVMDIVMPKAGTIGTLESTLDANALDPIISGLTSQLVQLSLPKFGYEGDAISLVELLQGLGMNLAFTHAADFSGITTADTLFISNVVHKAFLKVDEKGTEAAAATAVVAEHASAVAEPPPTPLVITVDHPFFFTIRDTATNTILFAGRIQDPTK